MDLCFQSKNVSPNNLTDVIFWNNFLALVFIFHFFLFKNKKKKIINFYFNIWNQIHQGKKDINQNSGVPFQWG